MTAATVASTSSTLTPPQREPSEVRVVVVALGYEHSGLLTLQQ